MTQASVPMDRAVDVIATLLQALCVQGARPPIVREDAETIAKRLLDTGVKVS